MRRATTRRIPMPKRRVRCLLSALAVTFAPASHAAEPDCAADVARSRSAPLREGPGSFGPLRTDDAARLARHATASGALVAKGEVVFAKPGKMRWSYASPEPSLVVSDGATLWVYDPQAHEVQKLPLGEGYLSAAGVQFLLGAASCRTSSRSVPAVASEPTVTLGLTPLHEAQYESLEMRVDRKSGVVRETTVVDLFGNRTRSRSPNCARTRAPQRTSSPSRRPRACA